ncbi:MAG: peptide deformylase, partial [Myxococcales bacterium]|nr:peptide deformylase [Myxococcales bacterium]
RSEFVSSQGTRHALTDPRVKVLFPSMGRTLCEAAAATFEGFGIRAEPVPPPWTPDERALLESPGPTLAIPRHGSPEAALLRRRSRELDPSADLATLERLLRATLAESGGVGLAAPQVGIGVRAILVTLDARSDAPRTIWCVNPRIERRSDELQDDLEGCLSIPDLCGLVRRHRALTVVYLDGPREVSLDVEGFDARIFQHEIDHLDGALYTDRLLGPPAPKDALRPLREELARRRAAGTAGDVLEPEQVADLWRAVLAPPADAAPGGEPR